LSNVLDSYAEVTTKSGDVNLQDVSRSFASARSGTGKMWNLMKLLDSWRAHHA